MDLQISKDLVLIDTVVKEEYDVEDPKDIFEIELEEAEPQNYEGFFCGSCSQFFGDELSFQEHLGVHSREAQDSCDFQRDFHQEAQTHNFLSADQFSGQIPQNLPVAKPKKMRKRAPGLPRCPTCGRKFFEEHELEEHRKSHRKQKRVQCSICFRDMGVNVLSRHMNVHTRQNIYQCNQCPAQFTTTQERNNHVKKEHWDRSKILCEICKTVCVSESDLKDHIMSHFKRSF